MEEAKAKQVRAWLVKAQHDLGAARQLALQHEPYLDVAAYHCQQAAEKGLKALLVQHDVRFGKAHDRTALVQQAARLDAAFACCLEAAELLTPYAVMFRYPGEALEPGPEEFEEAFYGASVLYHRVCQSLPDDVQRRRSTWPADVRN